MKAHVAAVLEATLLPAMLYNNPVAYGTDFTPEQIQELAGEFPNLQAVKESSTDVRRVTAIRALVGDRLAIFVGVDDAIVEGIAAGAVGWIAGLVNALPRESVYLFDWARAGKAQDAFELYRWFLPVLRMDTVPKFVQLIKQVQQELGVGCARARAVSWREQSWPRRVRLCGQRWPRARAWRARARDSQKAECRQSSRIGACSPAPASVATSTGNSGGRGAGAFHPHRNSVAGPQIRPWHGPMPHRVCSLAWRHESHSARSR
jgi:hypothetical protein